jgi:PAS domain S-box-containing protein
MRLPASFRDASIRRKFMFIAFLATVAATLFAMLAFTAMQWFLLRDDLAHAVSTQASIVASNSKSALLFNDREAAEQTLGALAAIDNIEFAGLLDKTGKDFALYVRPGAVMPPHQHPAAEGESSVYTAKYIEVVIPIVLKQERIGSIHVRSNLAPVYEQLAWGMLVTVAAATGAFLVAVMMLLRLLPAITDPLLRLIGLMKTVTRDKNYALRAGVHGKDEVGTLAQGFNSMLAQIQARDNTLEQQREHLDDEIVQRTAALGEANQLLEKELIERKRAEEKIRESEARYRGIFESADDIIYLLAPDGTFDSLSPSFERLTGWHPKEWAGKPFAPIIHPDDLPAARKVFQNAISGQITPAFELRIAKKSGGYFDSELSLAPVNPGGGKIVAIGIARDITERKQVEEQLRETRDYLENLFNYANAPIIVWNPSYQITMFNHAFERLTGRQAAEFIGKPIDILFPDVHRDEALAKIHQTTRTGERWETVEIPILHASGAIKTALWNSATVYSADGQQVLATIAQGQDITERKQMEVALKTNELRLQMAIECGHMGVWELDLIDHTAYRSLEHDRIFGYESLLPLWTLEMFLDHVLPEERSEVHRKFDEAVAKQTNWSFECRIRRLDGEVRWIWANGSHQSDINGVMCRMVGIVQDITERKQAEDEIRQLNEELDAKVKQRTQQLLEAQDELLRKEKLAVLGQVAGSVGHELRNPLGVMNNAVYFLQTVLPDADDSVKEYLNIIKNEIAGSERIVSDLLDSVRTKPPHAEITGVRELLEQTLHKLSMPSSIAIKLDIPDKISPLRVDAMQIQQVLRNLISNGVEAMPEGGTLEIGASEDAPAGILTISVRDSGSGMAPEILPKLFQPLFTTKARGIGLGLVVVKNLTEANGGTVKVQSEAGKGTLFTVTLPAADGSGIPI